MPNNPNSDLVQVRPGGSLSLEDPAQPKAYVRTYNSFSGVDILAAVHFPAETRTDRPGGKDDQIPDFRVFAELQTLTISSFRGVSPVRRLGEAFPAAFVRGGRTVAGSMVFTVIEKDVWSNLYRRDPWDKRPDGTLFVDQLPPFTITITAANEYGQTCTQAILGVVLTNFGTSYSVDDLFVESTYGYVAQAVTPFMPLRTAETLRRIASQTSIQRVTPMSMPFWASPVRVP